MYEGLEDRFRMGIFFANKDKIAKHDELIKFGLDAKKLEMDSFADFTREELFKLREEMESPLCDEEWKKYKVSHVQWKQPNLATKQQSIINILLQFFQLTYGKIYDDFEDKFRKTIFFIVKDTIKAHDKLYEKGLSTYKLGINQFTDTLRDELPGSLVLSNKLPYWAPYRIDHLRIANPVEHFNYYTRGLFHQAYPLTVF